MWQEGFVRKRRRVVVSSSWSWSHDLGVWELMPQVLSFSMLEPKMKPAHLLSSFALRNFSSRRAISSQIAAFSFKNNVQHNHIKWIKDQGIVLGRGSIFQTKKVYVTGEEGRAILPCRQAINKSIGKGSQVLLQAGYLYNLWSNLWHLWVKRGHY